MQWHLLLLGQWAFTGVRHGLHLPGLAMLRALLGSSWYANSVPNYFQSEVPF